MQRWRGVHPAVRRNEARGCWELTKICQSVPGLGDFLARPSCVSRESILSFSQNKFFHWPSIQEVRNASARALGPSTVIEPSPTHTWLSLEGRHLEIEAGKPLLHQFCTKCRRNFVCDLSSGKWHAVLPRIFDFEHLDQVSEQWLKETCPRQYLTSDARWRVSYRAADRIILREVPDRKRTVKRKFNCTDG